jgi:hypothetical protein
MLATADSRTAGKQAVERRRNRRRGLVALLASLSLAGLGSSALSLAVFTDNDDSTWSFAAGSVDIESSPAVLVAVSAMMPGDSSTQGLTIQNAGSASLRYALTTVATTALGDELRLEIKTVGSGCAAWDGASVLASTALDGAAFGNPAQGSHAGDRTLAGGASEVLCFRVSLPLAAPSTAQGLTSDATFTFAAEQTANNP